MDKRTVAGVDVLEAVRGGRRYVYPADYPDRDRIQASVALSASHDDGDVVALPVDPERYAAQDAYFSTGTPQSDGFVESMASLIDPRFPDVLTDALADDATVTALHRLGEHLKTGGSVINAVPHGPLLDIGLMHGAMYIALTRLGYAPRAGIVISHGIAGRGRRFGDELVCLADALDWACDKVWYVTPRTSRTDTSSYAEVVPAERIAEHNAVVRADVAATQELGNYVITVAPSATSDRRDEQGVHWMRPPTTGTLRMLAQPNTVVAIGAGRFLGVERPAFRLDPELLQVIDAGDAADLDAQGADIMQRMVAAMNALPSGAEYRLV